MAQFATPHAEVLPPPCPVHLAEPVPHAAPEPAYVDVQRPDGWYGYWLAAHQVIASQGCLTAWLRGRFPMKLIQVRFLDAAMATGRVCPDCGLPLVLHGDRWSRWIDFIG